jgi:hypothetical protein
MNRSSGWDFSVDSTFVGGDAAAQIGYRRA